MGGNFVFLWLSLEKKHSVSYMGIVSGLYMAKGHSMEEVPRNSTLIQINTKLRREQAACSSLTQ